MPESWGTPSPGPSPNYPEAVFDDGVAEEAGQPPYDEDGDESRLVRSASIGKRGKASLVTTPLRGLETGEISNRPAPSPVQSGPFVDGTGYVDGSSSSSSTVQTVRQPVGAALTADTILEAYDAASATDPSNPSRRMSVSPQPPGSRPYSRLSAVRRPPKLDIDAVRKAESRGSLTSLPDLIRRATRLAASLERGKRPASRFDDLSDFPAEIYGGRDGEKELSCKFSLGIIAECQLTLTTADYEKHQSGLSDMLAAFPPPAQATTSRRSIRQSLRDQVGSWPLPININRSQSSFADAQGDSRQDQSGKRRRKCCGLPLWGFWLVLAVVLVVIAAAVVIPLEFLVIQKRNIGNNTQAALQQCQSQIKCANGGTNVVNNGFCSCICTNGFTGFDCTVSSTDGCTTTDVSNGNTNIDNVTLGNAIPRLIQQSQTNFSIPLSGSGILAKFNAANLSCTAENALVTFDGESIRQGDANAVVMDTSPTASGAVNNAADVVNGIEVVTVTVLPGASTALTLNLDTSSAPAVPSASVQLEVGTGFSTIVSGPSGGSTGFATTISIGVPYTATRTSVLPTTTTTVTTTVNGPTGTTSAPSATFTVTEKVLDFARIAVLFILQAESLSNAEQAQGVLQRFLTSANDGLIGQSGGESLDSARNVSLGNGNTVDLINFAVDTGF